MPEINDKKKHYMWQVGGGTDIGEAENQDDFFVWNLALMVL